MLKRVYMLMGGFGRREEDRDGRVRSWAGPMSLRSGEGWDLGTDGPRDIIPPHRREADRVVLM